MDKRGYEVLNTALAEVEFGVEVLPVPNEGEDCRYITMNTSVETPPATILNALGRAGLMQQTGGYGYEDAVPQYHPSLKPLGVVPGSLTFEDVNA